MIDGITTDPRIAIGEDAGSGGTGSAGDGALGDVTAAEPVAVDGPADEVAGDVRGVGLGRTDAVGVAAVLDGAAAGDCAELLDGCCAGPAVGSWGAGTRLAVGTTVALGPVLLAVLGTAVGVGVGVTEVGFGGGGPPSVLKIAGARTGVGDGPGTPTGPSRVPTSLGCDRTPHVDSAVPGAAGDRAAASPTDGASSTLETTTQNAVRRARPQPKRRLAANRGERCRSETLTPGCVLMAPRVREPSVRASNGPVIVAYERRTEPYDHVTRYAEARPHADGVPLAAG